MSRSFSNRVPLRRWVVVGLALIAAVVGGIVWFTGSSSKDKADRTPPGVGPVTVLIDTQGSANVFYNGLTHGRLGLDADGCVIYEDPLGDRQVVVWPVGTQVRGTGADVRIRTAGQTFKLGDDIVFGTASSPKPPPGGCDGPKTFIHMPDHDLG